jgi:diguanylate cyclase (GGDEF)-like protein
MKKVLIVDDSKTILTLLKNEFSKEETIDAFFAKDYKEAQELIKQEKNFHAALLDLNLPDAPHGEIVQLANDNNIPAVVLSATHDEELKSNILKGDVVDFVLKDDIASISFAIKAISRTLKNYDTTILIVDDSNIYRTVMANSLKKIHINVLEAKDGQEALTILENNPKISLVITDYEMPVLNGLELTFKIREKYKKDQLAIIAISSVDKQETISKFLRFGANDFIHKPFSDNEIITRINSNLELLDLFSQIKDMANKDFLTGLYNRRYFFDSGKQIVSKARRRKQHIAVAMIDIDKFKNLNDTYGHDVGDVAIKEVKNILEYNLRNSDLIARFGGEEFCILLDEISYEDTLMVFEKIRKSFESNIIDIGDISISYTVSIGIFYGMEKISLDKMIKIADDALYTAKNNGRNQIIIKS